MDSDGDGVPDACDICDGDDTADADGDGVPDSCDICAQGDDNVDSDGDGVPDACDICELGDDSEDADGDGVPDACDICELGDDNVDTDGNGTPDACDDDGETGCETAFARYSANNTCFLDDGFNRWGWTNFFNSSGSYNLELYAGAAQCDYQNKGEQSGNVTVNWDDNNMVTVTINLLPGFVMQEAHLYIGGNKYPTANNGSQTVAPGQYPVVVENLNNVTTYQFGAIDVSGFSNGIYVIVHAVTCNSSNLVQKQQVSVKPYPTLFSEELNVEIKVPNQTNGSISIYGMQGNITTQMDNLKFNKGKNSVRINTSNLSPSMYLLLVRTSNGDAVVKKVIHR